MLARAGGPIARLASLGARAMQRLPRAEARRPPQFPNLVSQAVTCSTAPSSTAGLMVRGSGARRGVDIAVPGRVVRVRRRSPPGKASRADRSAGARALIFTRIGGLLHAAMWRNAGWCRRAAANAHQVELGSQVRLDPGEEPVARELWQPVA